MKRIYTTADPVVAGFLEGVLRDHGIRCITRNAQLAGAGGELPLNELWPQLWVLDDADLEPARRIVEETLAGCRERETAWECPGCGERLEPQFAQCWRCGARRED